MTDAVIYAIELLVGVGCVALALPLWRRGGRPRLLAPVLGALGLLAMRHAVLGLLS